MIYVFVHQVNDQVENFVANILFDIHEVLFVNDELYLDKNLIVNVVIVTLDEEYHFLQFLTENPILMWIFV